MPPGGRGRRMVGWGVVAWTGIGVGVLALALGLALGRVAGVVPYLVVASMVVFILNPAVARTGGQGGPPPRGGGGGVRGRGGPRGGRPRAPGPRHDPPEAGAGAELADPAAQGRGRRRPALPLLQPAAAPGRRSTTSWVNDHAGTVRGELQHVRRGRAGAGARGPGARAGRLPGVPRAALAAGRVAGDASPRPAVASRRGRPVARPGPAAARRLRAGPLGRLRGGVRGRPRSGMWAVGMPFWLMLGVIVGVANLIPMFGAWIGAIPVILVSLATKPPAFLLVVLAVIAVAHVVDGYVLSPMRAEGGHEAASGRGAAGGAGRRGPVRVLGRPGGDPGRRHRAAHAADVGAAAPQRARRAPGAGSPAGA